MIAIIKIDEKHQTAVNSPDFKKPTNNIEPVKKIRFGITQIQTLISAGRTKKQKSQAIPMSGIRLKKRIECKMFTENFQAM